MNIDDFVGNFVTDVNQLSVDNRFNITGTAMPVYPLNQLVQSVVLPGASFPTQIRRDFGPPRQYPYDIAFNELNVIFYDTKEQEIKNYYDTWMFGNGGNGHKAVYPRGSVGFNYMDEYVAPMRIQKLDRQNDLQYTIVVTDCYPKTIQDVSLSQTSTSTLSTFTVTFQYLKWEIL